MRLLTFIPFSKLLDIRPNPSIHPLHAQVARQRNTEMKPASTMSHSEQRNPALQYLQPGYARFARAEEACGQEGFVRLR